MSALSLQISGRFKTVRCVSLSQEIEKCLRLERNGAWGEGRILNTVVICSFCSARSTSQIELCLEDLLCLMSFLGLHTDSDPTNSVLITMCWTWCPHECSQLVSGLFSVWMAGHMRFLISSTLNLDCWQRTLVLFVRVTGGVLCYSSWDDFKIKLFYPWNVEVSVFLIAALSSHDCFLLFRPPTIWTLKAC